MGTLRMSRMTPQGDVDTEDEWGDITDEQGDF